MLPWIFHFADNRPILNPLCGKKLVPDLKNVLWTAYPEREYEKTLFLDHTYRPDIKRCEICVLLLFAKGGQ